MLFVREGSGGMPGNAFYARRLPQAVEL